MGLEEKLPSGVLLTTVENLFGYMRSAAFWPATFGLAGTTPGAGVRKCSGPRRGRLI
jgi:NADH:ubiquinone oxidoreductase subunit B-like Fe-S oxidoreductase